TEQETAPIIESKVAGNRLAQNADPSSTTQLDLVAASPKSLRHHRASKIYRIATVTDALPHCEAQDRPKQLQFPDPIERSPQILMMPRDPIVGHELMRRIPLVYNYASALLLRRYRIPALRHD